jgi:small subunit ribosomal protein S6
MDMRLYETLYLINPDLADEDYRSEVEKYNALVEKQKGVVIKTDEWGKRTLAYPVKKFKRGFYVLLQFCGDAGVVDELKRVLRLDERVLKFQTIKLSDHTDPEALKAKADKTNVKTAEADAEVQPTETGSENKQQEEVQHGV